MRKTILTIALIAGLALPAQLLAGHSSAILGAEGYFAGALPPPGAHFINYLMYYHAGELNDHKGDKKSMDFQADVAAEVLRGIYISDIKILGANLGWHLIVPLAYMEMEIKDVPAPRVIDDSRASIGDIDFSPFLLGWHTELFHVVVGLDIIAPTGQYNRKHFPVNIGNNHWTFEPALAVSMIHPSGVSASVKLMYDIHTKNTDGVNPDNGAKADYLTGQQFHLDYNAGYMIVDNFRLGVCGYYLIGLQDDKLDGTKVSDSKEQVLAVGPSAMYSFNPGLHLVAKVQFETLAENRSEGTKGWLKLIYSF
ncbi:MAG: transporter [Candidatus Euphemobacter frigidus]|nr:transporter [Candidatus Euphemobacter frigidus]MDP8275679.1 transporter [Candidatus Euphemobacter frigidus]